ncbi:hypothetical protein K501DRAFT_187553 [Backusella circina FSU 941]|nr:hypothetical protein K501DRAFT_187553 [Backusella circina FSU 941]
MLKSIFFGISTIVATATANLYVYMPDNSSTWYTGSTGNVLWNSSAAEFGRLCRIQLISVDTQDVVYTMAELPCSADKYRSDPLPSFEGERFLVRVGEGDDDWVYTQDFTILNNATTSNDSIYRGLLNG